MLSQIKARLASPTFQGEKKSRTARLLNTILIAIIGLVLIWVFILPLVSSNPVASLISLGLVLLISFSTLVGLRKGYVRGASLFFVSTSWVLVTVVSYYFGGLNNDGIHSYLIVVLIAGLLLGGRVAFTFAGLSILFGLGLHYLGRFDLLPVSLILHDSLETWIVLTFNLILTAVLLYLASQNIEDSLERAHHEIRERKRTEEAVQRLAEQRKQLLIASQTMLSTLTLDEVIEQIFQALSEVLEFDGCSLYWFEETTRMLTPHIISEADKTVEKLSSLPVPEGEGIVGAVIASGQSELVNNAHLDSRSVYPEEVQLEKEHLICIPIQIQDRRVGALIVGRISDPPFTEEEFELVRLFVAQASIAIENAQLYQQAQQEIAERKRIEQALRESEQKYRTLIERMNEGLTQIDGNGIINFVNDRFCEIIGYSHEEIVGQKAYDLLLQDKDVPFAKEKYRLRQQGISDQYEIQLRKKSGELIWVHVSAAPIKDVDGKVIGSVGIYTDITERKWAEEEKARLEEQLRHAQKMEAIGTLAGGIAHDFNNILTGIIGYADLTLDTLSVNHPVYKDIESIKRMAERAAGLTRQLLAFARQQLVQPDKLNLNNLIRSLKARLRRMVENAGLDLEFQLQPKLGLVQVDSYQIEQILFSVIENAQEAMPDGGKITIKTANILPGQASLEPERKAPSGEYALLVIQDTGVGMSDEVKSHIFEPFFTTKGVGQGAGMGLATAFGIIQQSGGYIEAESEPGQGTTIKIYLPCIPGHDDQIAMEASSKKETPPLQAGHTILLVEDDSSIRYITRRMLSHQGYRVIEASNGSEALDLIQTQNQIDLVITDVIMPQMGGKELITNLRALQPGLKVLFISGHADNSFNKMDTSEPETDFLQKPFTPGALAQKVQEMLVRN